MARGVGPLGLEEHPGGAGHALHPAGQRHVGVSDGDGPRARDHRFEAGAAQAVDRRAGHRHGQPGQERGHAGHVAVVLARAVGVTEVHLVDGGRVELRRPLHDGLHRHRREVVGPHAGQRATMAPHRRPHGIDDEDILQAHRPPSS